MSPEERKTALRRLVGFTGPSPFYAQPDGEPTADLPEPKPSGESALRMKISLLLADVEDMELREDDERVQDVLRGIAARLVEFLT